MGTTIKILVFFSIYLREKTLLSLQLYGQRLFSQGVKKNINLFKNQKKLKLAIIFFRI